MSGQSPSKSVRDDTFLFTGISSMSPTDIELERLRLQAQLDASTPREQRGRLGQFATPPEVASEIAAARASGLTNQAPVAPCG